MEEVEAVIPATIPSQLNDTKTTAVRYRVEKEKHREVLSKWCVARGCQGTTTLVVKRRKTSSVD
jgi:phosphopantetheinyl transferase